MYLPPHLTHSWSAAFAGDYKRVWQDQSTLGSCHTKLYRKSIAFNDKLLECFVHVYLQGR